MADDSHTDMRRPAAAYAAGTRASEPADGASADTSGLVVAFFDLDGTLIVGNTQFLLIKFLRARGVIGRRVLLGSALWFLAYKAGLVKATEEARAKAASLLKGLTQGEVAELMAVFTEEVLLPRAYEPAVAALRTHAARGDRVVILSAALEPLVASLSTRLNVTHHAGAPCRLQEGRYAGSLSGPTPYADEKARVAAGFMGAWGADAAVCWAYADHATDLPLLRSVGHPVAVNPRPALAAAARSAGWPIL